MNTFRALFVFTLLISNTLVSAQAVRTEIKQVNGEWRLFRDGNPYFVKGGGGHVQLDKLVSIGGNSIRTWSTDNAREILDEAQKHGLTVMMGLWVQHERHGVVTYISEQLMRKSVRPLYDRGLDGLVIPAIERRRP